MVVGLQLYDFILKDLRFGPWLDNTFISISNIRLKDVSNICSQIDLIGIYKKLISGKEII